MKADYIKDIIASYHDLPYECILIDGPWGVGKSYAIKEALVDDNGVCDVSMFGLKSAQEIYHEAFFQLIIKTKKKKALREFTSKAINWIAGFSDKISFIKGAMESLVTEKELFLYYSKGFKDLRFIVIDDLERMNDNIKLEEVFGIIEELKRCLHLKVILVANTEEMSQKEQFEKYSEKVIDRTYHITECSAKVDWVKLRIHPGFITDFLNKHQVKNLRTLQKAQNLYDDVRLKLSDDYGDEFYDEIRWACYAIVVESVENLYYREFDDAGQDVPTKIVRESSNKLENRIIDNYLRRARISKNMAVMLQRYYENESDLIADEVGAEHQIFVHAGEKANYYKSDDELKLVLPELAKKVREEPDFGNMLKYADAYFIWSEHLQIDDSQMKDEYKTKLSNMMYEEAKDGSMEFLTYGFGAFEAQSQTSKGMIEEVKEIVKIRVIKEYIKYLSETTHGERAYQYSYTLRKFVDNMFSKDIILGKVDALYNEKSFPIHDVTEQQYHTAYNIMYVLYHENKERFLNYCDEVRTKCDNMATHRIEVLLDEIIGK